MKYSPYYKMCARTFQQKLKQGLELRIEKFVKEFEGQARSPKEWMMEYVAWTKRKEEINEL